MLKLEYVGECSHNSYYRIKKQVLPKQISCSEIFAYKSQNGKTFKFYKRAYPEIIYQGADVTDVFLRGHQKERNKQLLVIRKGDAECLEQAVVALNKFLESLKMSRS
jgi:hypothetical protein